MPEQDSLAIQPDHLITVNYDGNNFVYGPFRRQHAKSGESFRWLLVPAGGAIGTIASMVIDFDYDDDSSPFPQEQYAATADTHWLTPIAVSSEAEVQEYSYTVELTMINGDTDSDDPQIIFDDLPEDEEVELFEEEEIISVTGTAHATIETLLSDLRAVERIKRDANSLFFPGGITNFSAEITTAGNASIKIDVSGPSPAKEEK